jgi:hypothetical protein
MDTLKPEIARLIAAKEQRRHKLAALPFAEKVRIVVQLQRMAAPVLRARGRAVHVWALANSEARHEAMTPPRRSSSQNP